MSDLPKFTLYGDADPAIKESMQPQLDLRGWGDLSREEKEIALQQIYNRNWLTASRLIETISKLNNEFLRVCPGKALHKAPPDRRVQMNAAVSDFNNIFLDGEDPNIVLRMLSRLLEQYIDWVDYDRAEKTTDAQRAEYIKSAFHLFDGLARDLNHIFEQFAVNILVTRSGFVPRQDQKIAKELYAPTLAILADPKWRTVSDDLAEMFADYREQKYAEVIAKAHRAVQRFLQVVLDWEEGKNGKGELGRLLAVARERGILPKDSSVTPILNGIASYLPSERANNSTAKPAVKDTTSSEALLMMNVTMSVLQFVLNNDAAI